MSKRWRYLLPLAWPLLAVNVAIALLYAVLWCRGSEWSFRNGVLTFIAQRPMIGNPHGQGWSPIVGYASDRYRKTANLRAHENCHVVQETAWAYVGLLVGAALFALGSPVAGIVAALCGGPMFAITYGASFLIEYLPSVRREYKFFRDDDVDRRTSLKLALAEWRPSYENIIYERQAYARQGEYVAMTPKQRLSVWT